MCVSACVNENKCMTVCVCAPVLQILERETDGS